MLYSILVSLDVLIAAALIALVLLQRGAGAAAGAAFGGGGGTSGSVFGAKGSSSFMSRATAILAAAFFINSIVLAYLASNRAVSESVIDSMTTQEQQVDMPSDIPGVVNVPEGASSEEMMDIIKTEIEKKAAEKADATIEQVQDATEQAIDNAQDVIQENSEQAMPSDIPQ